MNRVYDIIITLSEKNIYTQYITVFIQDILLCIQLGVCYVFI